MSKNAAQQDQWLNRSASRSTVPSKRGHFRGLEGVAEIREMLVPLEERRDLLMEALEKCRQERKALNGFRMRKRDFEVERERLGQMEHELNRKLSEVNGNMRAFARDGFFATFHQMAYEILDEETYLQIRRETFRLCGFGPSGHSSEGREEP